MKKTFYAEFAYIIGLVLIAVSSAFITLSDLGVSMVVAPAYLLHLKVSETFSIFSFGMAEYTLQAVLLVIMMIVIRKFRPAFLFSFLTAVLYGFILDGSLYLVGLIPHNNLAVQIVFFVVGVVVCSFGVAVILHTYMAPEVYELIAKEVPKKFNLNLSIFKTCYDVASLLIAVAMSFIFFGKLRGVGVGTIICALVNGILIGTFSKWLEKHFEFKDIFKFRKYFE